jgi:regulator of protease activity HflC (stomatin/prohibitin superfamily)
MNVVYAVIGVVVVALLAMSIKILREYERGVVFRLGRLIGAKGPGFVMIIPFIDRMLKVSLRTVAVDVTPQDIITKDNVSVKVNAVLYFKVIDPQKVIVEVEDYNFAISQLSQTTLRSVLGQSELDELLSERSRINANLRTIIDHQAEQWGINIVSVEVKDIDLPEGMKRAMAKQAEAERERRAKVINAEGEYQAATRLADAAQIISDHPMALQLRFLQTLVEVATEKNSTTIFPVPIDLLKPFIK